MSSPSSKDKQYIIPDGRGGFIFYPHGITQEELDDVFCGRHGYPVTAEMIQGFLKENAVLKEENAKLVENDKFLRHIGTKASFDDGRDIFVKNLELAELKKKNAELEKKNAELEKKNADLKKDSCFLHNIGSHASSSYQRTVDVNKKEIDALKKENNELNEKIKRNIGYNKKKIDALNDYIDVLEKRITEREKQITEFEAIFC
jgi:flagellar biosynthesis chaperone FliJ